MVGRFKIGDKIRIVSETPLLAHEGGPGWNSNMTESLGTIDEIESITQGGFYILRKNTWSWKESWLLPIKIEFDSEGNIW